MKPDSGIFIYHFIIFHNLYIVDIIYITLPFIFITLHLLLFHLYMMLSEFRSLSKDGPKIKKSKIS